MSIVEKNVKLMESARPGGMMVRLRNESWGAWEGGIVINFHYNRFTGKILYFANSQDIPKKIANNSNNTEGSFHFKFKKIGNDRFPTKTIDRIEYGDGTEEARAVLSLSASTFEEIDAKFQAELHVKYEKKH